MAENVTSNLDIYNRANNVGKATEIQSDDLFYLQRGTGSDRDKCIKGSDIIASSGLVIATTGDDRPAPLLQKLYNSDTIAFEDTTVSGIKKVTADIKSDSISTFHLIDQSVTTTKINDYCVTHTKMADDAVGTDNIINASVTQAKLEDASVSTAKLQNASVSGAKLGTSLINSQYSVNLLIGTDIDQSTNTFASKIHTFNGVDYGGIVDVSVHALGVNITYMDNVKFQLRKSGSNTAETEWDVDKLLETELSRRLLVKNGVNSSATYELWIVGDITSAMPSIISGFLACEVDLRGISIA